MKKSFSFLTLLFPICMYAQEKTVVAVMPITGISYTAYDAKSKVTGIVQRCFSSKIRFVTVDRSKIDDLSNERNLQKNEDFLNGKVADQGKSIGADFIVSGNLSSLMPNPRQFEHTDYNTKQKYYVTQYEGVLNLSLTVVSVETGGVKASKSFSLKTGKFLLGMATGGFYATELEALNNVTDQLEGEIMKWINEVFAEEMKIIRVESQDKKSRPETVLIKGGSETNLKKNSRLDVLLFEEIVVDNETMQKTKKIGELKVEEVQGSNLSVCKVTDGAEEIQDAMNAGKKLLVKISKY